MLQFYLYVNAATKRISHRCRPHYRSCSRCCPRFHPRPSRPHSLLSPSLSPVTVARRPHLSLSPSLSHLLVTVALAVAFSRRPWPSPSLSPSLVAVALAVSLAVAHCCRPSLLPSPLPSLSPFAVALAHSRRPRSSLSPSLLPLPLPLLSPVDVARRCRPMLLPVARERDRERDRQQWDNHQRDATINRRIGDGREKETERDELTMRERAERKRDATRRAQFMFHVVACERFENRFANGEIWVWTCRSTPWFENRRSCKSICKSFLRFFICKWTICKNKLNFFCANLPIFFFSDRRNDLTFANRPTNSQPYIGQSDDPITYINFNSFVIVVLPLMWRQG